MSEAAEVRRTTTRAATAGRAGIALAAAALAGLALTAAPPASASVEATYLYDLSDASGVVPSNWAVLRADPESHEVFAADVAEPSIRVFNGAGMEVYRFGDDGRLGGIADVAALPGGDLLVLSRTGSRYAVTRCDFRGEPLREVAVSGAPAGFADAVPEILVQRSGRVYLADLGRMKVLVVDAEGRFLDGYDLAAALDLGAKQRSGVEIVGFDVDPKGNLLFTVPVFFQAYVLSPDRKLQAFGERGSRAGKFNIVGGITADERGYLYVVDQLRCVVIVFDPQFGFQTEFGYRGEEPGNLISPRGVLAEAGRVYVNQSGNRGVRVYRVAVN